MLTKIQQGQPHFNTTLVSVRAIETKPITFTTGLFQYNSCVGSRKLESATKKRDYLFQYNSCVGSRISRQMLQVVQWDFNTTLVSVRE